jgi:hypothetical protein
MIDMPVLAGVLPPLLALASLLAIAWLRRRDRAMRAEAQRLCRQLACDLDTLYARGEAIRQRAILVTRVYDDASLEEQADLTLGCYHDLDRVETLRTRVAAASEAAGRLRGSELRARHAAIRRIEGEIDLLTSDLAQSHAFWASQLSGGLNAEPAARMAG